MLDTFVTRRSAHLDVIRGAAILAVVAVHTFQFNFALFNGSGILETDRTFVFTSYLRFGVELFFALSGWLIFSIYRSRSGERSLQYLAKRAARIWPLWIVFSLLSFLSLVLFWTTTPVESRFSADSWYLWILALILVILFLGWLSPGLWNIPPGGWSIQVEIGHYALFWLMRKFRDVTFLLSILVGYASYFIAVELSARLPESALATLVDGWLRLGLYGTWPFFVAGGLALIWSRIYQGVQEDLRSVSTRWILIRASLVMLVLAIAWYIPIPFGMSYEAIMACIVLLAFSWIASKWVKSRNAGALIGRYSYFVYFAHFWILTLIAGPIVGAIEQLGPGSILYYWVSYLVLLLITLALSVLIAVPSWKFFESYWIRMSHRV